ncbi:DUF5693 family protein [Halocella sp. SP3-1]|uniref:DUF5693 family protein n=1 Tax=Halocella sp. SP3-1 TaxID=2382161 RepID=UPI000F75AB49|nr:DUF5693 family protein [Halocella sp. SP3-1]AZO94084.1 hypothetical protein D7D81_05460 [Halocella sp. SP3-1]
MRKKFLLIIFILALFVSLLGVYGRYKIDNSSNGVELIMDYKALASLDRNEIEFLGELKEAGLTAVAVLPDTIKELVNTNRVNLIKGNELIRAGVISGRTNLLMESFQISRDSAVLYIDSSSLIKGFLDRLPSWQEEYGLDYLLAGDELLVFFEKWHDKYLSLGIGFEEGLITEIRKAGLKIVPRIDNNELTNKEQLALLADYSPRYLIFNGTEVTGYQEGSKEGIRETANLMLDHDIIFGMIEPFIARQAGAASLAHLLDYRLLRVHSIQQAEMDSNQAKYSLDNIVNRYYRAVKERNVRLLYLKPFLKEKDNKKPDKLTEEFIASLAVRLKTAGYLPGQAELYRDYENSFLALLLIGLGITVAGIILLGYLINKDILKWSYLMMGLVIIVEVLLFYKGRGIFLRKVLALASAIIFPTLAVVTQVLNKEEESLLLKFLKTAAISLLGGVFLTASLAHTSFVLKINQFVGVKLAFVLPLILISFYYFKTIDYRFNDRQGSFLEKLNRLLDYNLKLKHLVLLFVLAVGGFVYIGRTGNYPLLPVSGIELHLREFLEKLLIARPRFKEFLIGHPSLVLALGMVKEFKNKLLFYPFLLLASIGQITVLNSFSHIHTPLLITVIRVFHGLWLGLLLGYILLSIFRYLVKRFA